MVERERLVDNLKDKLESLLPITDQKIMIDQVNEKQLLDFKKKCEQRDHSMFTCRPIIRRSKAESLQAYADILERKNGFQFGLYDLSNNPVTDTIIGQISLFDYNPRNRSVELGYMLEETYEGRGLMKKALLEVFTYLYGKADINKIYAQTASINKKSIGLLLSLGFSVDARLREHHEYKGKFYDDYIFSLLAKEFKKGLPEKI